MSLETKKAERHTWQQRAMVEGDMSATALCLCCQGQLVSLLAEA